MPNVGIGTTSPGYKLDVAGAINATALKINGVDVSAGGSPGGATTQVQFNDSGAFAGDSDFIWDKTNKRLGVKTATPSAALSVEEGNTAGIIGGRAYIGGWTGGASEGVFANGNMNAWNTTNYAIRQNDVGRTVVNSANGYELQFAIENDEKMRVAADGKIGIGTTSPNGQLDVKGSIVMSGATSGYAGFQPAASAGSTIWTLPAADGTSGQVLSTDGAGVLSWVSSGGGGDFKADGSVTMTGVFKASNGTAAAPSITFGSNTNTGMYRVASNKIGFSTGGANRMVINNTGVGIGTTNPGAPLDVNGLINTAEGLMVGGYGALENTDNTLKINYTSGAFNVAIYPGGYNPAAIWIRNPTGEVGIGTTSPNGKLDVKGSLVLSGATSGYTGFQPAAAAGSTVWTLPSADGTSGQVLKTDGSGTLSWVSVSDTLSGLSCSSGQVPSWNGSAWVCVSTSVSNSNNTLVLRDGSGNVGANVVTANGLSLSNGASSTITLTTPAAFTSYALQLPSTYGTNGQVLTSDGAGNASWTTPGGGSLWTAHSPNISYDGGGNVGIGTTAPSSLLQVRQDAAGQTDTNITNKSNSASAMASVTLTNDAGDIGGLFSPSSAYTLSHMRNRLSLQSLSAATGIDIAAGGGTADVRIYAGGAMTAQERMRVTANGDVGIGTTSPNVKLHVSDSANTYLRLESTGGSSGIYANYASGSAGGLYFWGASILRGGVFADTDHSVVLKTQNSTPLRFLTGNVEKMRITASGNVGIGTTSPTQMLEVNGTVLASAYLYSSDRRLKKDITPLEQSLEKLLTLNTVKFNWIEPKNKDEERTQIGLIAQDVQKVFPEAVKEDSQGWLRMNYQALISPIIDGMREMYHKLMNVDAKTDALQARVNDLEAKNKALEERLSKIEATLQKASTQPERAPAGH